MSRKSSRRVLSISRRDSTASLGSLFQCSITPKIKKFKWVSCVTVCACYPFLWAPPKKVWPYPLDTSPLDIYKLWWDPHSVFASPGWTTPGLSSFPHKGDPPLPQSSSWSTAELSPVVSCLSSLGIFL